jgi:hypothetical protein
MEWKETFWQPIGTPQVEFYLPSSVIYMEGE